MMTCVFFFPLRLDSRRVIMYLHCVVGHYAEAGTELQVETRGKKTPATTTKMPFVTCHYHRPAAK